MKKKSWVEKGDVWINTVKKIYTYLTTYLSLKYANRNTRHFLRINFEHLSVLTSFLSWITAETVNKKMTDHTISWELGGCYHYSKMLRWQPEGPYTAIVPFWFSTEHLWILIAPFWLSTDNIYYQVCHKILSLQWAPGLFQIRKQFFF